MGLGGKQFVERVVGWVFRRSRELARGYAEAFDSQTEHADSTEFVSVSRRRRVALVFQQGGVEIAGGDVAVVAAVLTPGTEEHQIGRQP